MRTQNLIHPQPFHFLWNNAAPCSLQGAVFFERIQGSELENKTLQLGAMIVEISVISARRAFNF
ncbi:hypothetical protein [Abditibacterium utsteinense]|uniref:hypothetical protein n=1 Tax=Abditibacterium utsteinense TaxID=1960156 RepID=UPI000CFD18C8|nr:hypothetical protein [Abditibacterium utsteinense]